MIDNDFDARFAQAIADIETRNAQDRQAMRSARGLWLSHHWDDQLDRCMVIGGRHVCRRCAVLYPVSAVLVVLSFLDVVPWPASADNAVIWGLSIVGSLDFFAEQLGKLAYSARRQIAATTLIGVAFGRAAGIEMQDRWNPQFWTPLLVFGALWLAVAVYGNRRRNVVL